MGTSCGRTQVCMKSEPSMRLLPHRQPLIAGLMQHHESSSVARHDHRLLEVLREIWVSACFPGRLRSAHIEIRANVMAWAVDLIRTLVQLHNSECRYTQRDRLIYQNLQLGDSQQVMV